MEYTSKWNLQSIPDAPLSAEWMRRIRLKRRSQGGRKKTMRLCKFCGNEYGAREMRGHAPHCPKKPT